MGIASLLLPEDSVFCYVVSREAAGEAPVTLEGVQAITSAPLVRHFAPLSQAGCVVCRLCVETALSDNAYCACQFI